MKIFLLIALLGTLLISSNIDALSQQATDIVKKYVTFNIYSFRVQKITNSGVDIRVALDIENRTPVKVKLTNFRCEVYFIKSNGTASKLATTSKIGDISINASAKNRIKEIKITSNYNDLLNNFEFIVSNNRRYRLVTRFTVFGQNQEFTNEIGGVE